MLYPKFYFDKITDITVEFLNENNIKALILDVDNTLIDIDRKPVEGLVEWHKGVITAGIKTIILSNSNKIDKIEKVAKDLEIEYISFGMKPLKKGFIKAVKKLELPAENIAAIGDQIFTDVIGANRCKIVSILVKPVAETDIWITKWKRPIENKIVKRYLEKQTKK